MRPAIPIPESYVQSAAAVIELPIDAAYLPGVVADFERAAAFAAHLMEFPLDPKIEAAPVFEP